MSNNELDGHESTDTELDERDVRALTEAMTVLPEGGDVYTVVGENGNGEHRVDTRAGRCTCPDHQYRDVRCKHQRRCAFATGERPIPAWVDTAAVDDLLGAHVDGQPVTAADTEGDTGAVATDGGIIEAGGEGEILDESGDDTDGGRPDDCDCGDWNDGLGLACWPCYREGFDEPAPVDDE